jgi:hypothetical protein
VPGLIRERVTNDGEVEKWFTAAKKIRQTATTVRCFTHSLASTPSFVMSVLCFARALAALLPSTSCYQPACTQTHTHTNTHTHTHTRLLLARIRT